jgi:Na+-transporting NADH:ubiquinone oxidoreductase subunit A
MQALQELESKHVTRVALLGRNYRGVNFELLCGEGDEVRAGAALMRDARRPEIRFCAPGAGRIAAIEHGARRRLEALRIIVDDSLGTQAHRIPAGRDAAELRRFLLDTGAWSSLRTRPYGNIPHPQSEPDAIFVTALDVEPAAPEPGFVIDACSDEFHAALELLANLGGAPVYVCHAPGHRLQPVDPERIRCVPFSGGPEAGLPGVHIHALSPIGLDGGEVWHLGYQDAIAIGHLLLHGSPWTRRVVSLAGSAIKNPRCLLVPPGAPYDELLAGELRDVPCRILSGSTTYGRPVKASTDFLDAGTRQVTALETGPAEAVAAAPRRAPLIPGERLERLAPPGILAVPLMRALQLGDAERARELGALELVEEDLAPLSHACVSNSDYGLLLRQVLNQLEGMH